MAKYRKRPIVVDAEQWFKNGDHSQDACYPIALDDNNSFMSEGKVVRYYRNPNDKSSRYCKHCGNTMHYHGWIDSLDSGHVVCPGDWVIEGLVGGYYVCKPDVFALEYERVKE